MAFGELALIPKLDGVAEYLERDAALRGCMLVK